jgi:hypothetical protein
LSWSWFNNDTIDSYEKVNAWCKNSFKALFVKQIKKEIDMKK